ncbi:hypothetical protein [Erwinia mallotivora]|uniref:hypothetical protein n=1 Tax=Erwinia mallotivora TaxID=69222 RepID=UPI0021BFC65E|nr:hypothetical protein [Erwinia mallotivora]
MSNTSLTPEQFRDLCLFVFTHGTFTSLTGINWRDLPRYDVIEQPGFPMEADTLYLADGWPAAVYEFDIGYTVISGALKSATNSEEKNK